MDWGTLVQRRAKKEAPDQGGWNIFCTTWEGLDVSVPGSHQPLRGNGADGWFGWATSPKREALREAWFAAPDQAAEKAIAQDLQTLGLGGGALRAARPAAAADGLPAQPDRRPHRRAGAVLERPPGLMQRHGAGTGRASPVS